MGIRHALLSFAVVGMVLVVNRAPAADDNGQPDHKTTLKDVIQQTKKTLHAVGSYTYAQKGEYAKKLRHTLHDLDQQMDVLKQKVEQASGRAQKRLQRQVKHLDKLRTQANEQLQKVKDATPETWDKLKHGVGDVFDKIGRGLEMLGQQIRR